MNEPGHPTPSILQYTTMTDSVVTQLKAWIRDGELRPGERLQILPLADRLGTSAMPVREGLRRLEAAGLVVRKAHQTVVVAQLSYREVRDLYDIRLLLEPAAAFHGATRVSESANAKMHGLVEMMAAAVRSHDTLAVLELDEQFLATLYRSSGNIPLFEMIRNIWERVTPYKRIYATSEESQWGETFWRDDMALLEACEKGNGPTARKIITRSLEDAQSGLVDFLSQQQESLAGESMPVAG